jgi:hypothetical protein
LLTAYTGEFLYLSFLFADRRAYSHPTYLPGGGRVWRTNEVTRGVTQSHLALMTISFTWHQWWMESWRCSWGLGFNPSNTHTGTENYAKVKCPVKEFLTKHKFHDYFHFLKGTLHIINFISRFLNTIWTSLMTQDAQCLRMLLQYWRLIVPFPNFIHCYDFRELEYVCF